MGGWMGLPEVEVDFYLLAIIVEEIEPVVSSGKAEGGKEGGPHGWMGGSRSQLHAPETRSRFLQHFQGGVSRMSFLKMAFKKEKSKCELDRSEGRKSNFEL